MATNDKDDPVMNLALNVIKNGFTQNKVHPFTETTLTANL
jgi:hypothetical protein